MYHNKYIIYVKYIRLKKKSSRAALKLFCAFVCPKYVYKCIGFFSLLSFPLPLYPPSVTIWNVRVQYYEITVLRTWTNYQGAHRQSSLFTVMRIPGAPPCITKCLTCLHKFNFCRTILIYINAYVISRAKFFSFSRKH